MNDRKINNEGGVDWESMIEGCGLSVDGKLSGSEVIDPSRAVLAVTGGYVQPVVSVRRESATAMESLDAQWQAFAAPLFASPAEGFLLILGGPGSLSEGWFLVRDPIGVHLPSRIASVTGRPEFMALSRNGKNLCAVSVEDDEYWVVTHDFSDRGV
jgi:hypothetical protein